MTGQPEAKRWFVDIMEVEGRCQVHFGYTRLPGHTVVWQSSPWVLPSEYSTEHQLLSELTDACLVLMERYA